MKVLANKRTGISLVALIVTIIVLIILTGAVIVTFIEGGIIDKAKYAVRKSDLATLQESYMIEYNKKKIDVDTGTAEGIDKIEILEKAVKSVKLEKDFEFAKYGTVNSVTYVGDNEDISEWVNELLYTDEEINADNYEGRFAIKNGKLSTFSVTLADINGQLGVEYTAKDINGNDIEDDSQKLGTGTKIYNENGEEILTVVYFGDTDGDANIDSSDAYPILYLIEGVRSIEEVGDSAIYAGDVNHDGYISTDDHLLLMNTFVGVKPKESYYKTLNITNNLPQIYNGYIYYTFNEEEVIEAFQNNGYTIDNNKIIIENGKTYDWLDREIKRVLGKDDIKITKSNVDIEGNTDTIVLSGLQASIGLSLNITSKPNMNGSNVTIKVKLQ